MDPSMIETSQRGIRCVRIPRYQHGFGFTLRHFIVYPPEYYKHSGESQSQIVQVTEPVDTIFVKSVKENGPAAFAGLCVGDRIVSVNGETIVGKSYDQVVHLIQKSERSVYLEVSPKQYDTLQLFYEEKAHRPETNQRPKTPHYHQPVKGVVSQSHSQYLDYYPDSLSYPGVPYGSSNRSYESVFVNHPPHHHQQLHNERSSIMSSAYPNQQPLFSHLPRPTPYKSTMTWSHLTSPPPQQHQTQQQQQQQSQQRRHQPQTYYPFQSPEFRQAQLDAQGGSGSGSGPTSLWGIREEQSGQTKSAESVLAGSSGHSSSSTISGSNNRYGSMECLSSVPPPVTWKNSPGYRFSISTGPGDSPAGSLEALRREAANLTLQGPPGGFAPPTVPSQEMIVTMSGGANEMSESSLENNAIMKGYEVKMADRIRRSTEQKEEFLRRPNQPMQWAPLQSQSSGVSFPKEFYAQPQKFQKVPWPPENVIPTISSSTQPMSASTVVSDDMTVTMRHHHPNGSSSNSTPTPKPTVVNLHKSQMEQLRNYSGSLDETTVRRLETVSNKLKQQQGFPKSSVNVSSGDTGSTSAGSPTPSPVAPSFTVTDFSGVARNRLVVVGSGKLHCDPPPGWKHPAFEETEFNVQKSNVQVVPAARPPRPTNLALPGAFHPASGNRKAPLPPTRLDPDVILRKRDNDPESENDRLVRRVSYLKATSSPIDMDRKSSSPTTPTKSPSAEFRSFGSFPLEKGPDSSEVVREGLVHFKVRAGDAKKGGFYRSWRQGWAQIRRSGCLYLAKERMTKETISGAETDVILCIGLKDGIIIEYANDYTKRKNVLRIKSSTPIPTVPTSGTTPAPADPIPIEILIQGDDPLDLNKWIQVLQQQQQDNNNCYSNQNSSQGVRINPNEMSSSRSILRNLLTTPQQSSASSQQFAGSSTSSNSNYLQTTLSTPTSSTTQATSPKSKTWKGKVARQWKKMHLSSNSSTSASLGSYAQSSIPESGATFGVLLEDCPQSEHSLVPKILEFCVDLVETRGLSIVGIYRIPGNSAAVAALTESLNKGNEPNPDADPRWNDVHVISSLLKSFLRNLHDPLLTSASYTDFIRAAADPDQEKALDKLTSLIHDLPDVNYETLRHLIFHLQKVARNSDKNRMDPKNLAIVFGPTVVRTAEESVQSLVNDMQHQCKIVELLVNNADEIFKEKDESPTPEDQENIPIPPPRIERMATSPPPKIESDIRASLIQAAQRKVLKQTVQPLPPPSYNTYGLPPHPLEKDRSVDESGLIRSYAGLGQETEERVRQFEMETRAMLYRDGRSPGLTAGNRDSTGSGSGINGQFPTSTSPGPKQSEEEKLRQEKLRLEAEWRRAKDDLENEDFYDQLADNPSSIVQHRDRGLPPYPLTTHNLSSSSISSTNSGGTPNPMNSGYGTTTWPIRLGPAPFKSQFSTQTLPPKPPGAGLISPSGSGRSSHSKVPSTPTTAPALVSPLRKVSSVERLTSSSEYAEEFESAGTTGKGSLRRLRNFEGTSNLQNYDSKAFGSLDSLRDLVNGSKEDLSQRSTDGSDLVASLSKTFDKKLQKLRPSKSSIETTQVTVSNEEENTPVSVKMKAEESVTQEPPAQINGGTQHSEEKETKKKIIRIPRRRSMIDRRKSNLDSIADEKEKESTTISYRDPSLHRAHISGNYWSGSFDATNGYGGDESSAEALAATLTKQVKTVSNKLRKSKGLQRRHSLNGTADILRLVLEDHKRNHHESNLSSDALATALTSNNILESHV